MAQQDLQNFGGNWTERKLQALGEYLDAYLNVFKNQPYFQTMYVDAFAGTGYREVKNDTELPGGLFEGDECADVASYLDGSASIALKTARPFSRYVFIEKHPERMNELKNLRLNFPQHSARMEFLQDDANGALRQLCRNTNWKDSRAVVFLDPYGMQIEWSTITAIAATKAIDVWILFPSGVGVNRLLTKKPSDTPPGWCNRLDRMFGTPEWREEFYQTSSAPTIFDLHDSTQKKSCTMEDIGAYFRKRLKTVFPFVIPKPLDLQNSRNSPMYQLHFAAGNLKGGPIALKIANSIIGKV